MKLGVGGAVSAAIAAGDFILEDRTIPITDTTTNRIIAVINIFVRRFIDNTLLLLTSDPISLFHISLSKETISILCHNPLCGRSKIRDNSSQFLKFYRVFIYDLFLI